jgi:ankyrin repeat protein
MRFLIAHGASPGDTGWNGDDDFSPPLVSAVSSGKAAAVNELLKYHPDVNAKGAGEDAIATLLTKTLDQSEDVQILQALIGAGANVNARDEFGRTPLIACSDTDYARALIDLGADVFARDKQGKTAAQTAREMGDNELADLLERAMASKQSSN